MISDYLLSPDPTAVLVGLHMIQHVTPQELWEELLKVTEAPNSIRTVTRTRKFNFNFRAYIAIRVYKDLGRGKIKSYHTFEEELGEAICIVLDLNNDIDMFTYTCYWNIDGWDHVDTTQLIYKHLDNITDDDKQLIYNKLLEYIHHEST